MMNSSFIQEPQTQKLSLNSPIKSIPFSSSRSTRSGFSRDVSCNKDFNSNFNRQKVKNPTREIKNPYLETYKKTLMVIESVGCEYLCPNNQMGIPEYYNYDNNNNNNQAYNYLLVNVNHCYVDEYMKPRTNEQVLAEDDKHHQLAKLRENNCYEKDLLQENYHCNLSLNSAFMNVVSMDEKVMGTQGTKFPFHIASIPKPQDEYKIVVNNLNQPFEHVWLQRSKDGSRYIHPLEKFTVNDFVDKDVSKFEPVIPPPVDGTPFKFVQEVQELEELVHKLRNATEFAVDLEHNQYRSFQGLTCLMQISTRTEDFIVDTLKLRVHIRPYLREVFEDPTKKKVMHGADKDIVWLQRDFGIYVCNMFDTGQASRVLKMEKNSLEHLLLYFCGVPLNKEYQKADWRLRPLTNEMLRYAREDTHYLLYLHDLMKRRLLSTSTDPNFPESPVMEVYRRSYNVCIQLYQKELFDEYSYLNIYGLHDADLNGRQLSIVSDLCALRDIVARAADESTGYVLSNKNVIEIAKQMPTTTGDLCRLLKFRNIHIQQNICSILSIIQNSEQSAAAFDEHAKKMKQERIEMEASRTANKRSEEASFMPSGSIVASQFGSAAEKQRLDHDTTKALLNISFGSYKRNPEPLHPTIKQHAKARETVKRNETNAMEEKRGSAVDSRAANEVEKNVSILSSSFQKCLQNTNGTKMSRSGLEKGGRSWAF